MRPAFVIARDGETVDERIEKLVMDSDYPVPKIRQGNFGLVEYTFASQPSQDSDIQMFEVIHSLGRIPFGFMLIAELVATDGDDFYTPVSDYSIRNRQGNQFNPNPPFNLLSASVDQKIRARMENNRILVSYFATSPKDAGFNDPNGDFEPATMIGRTFLFKFYIMSESEDDDDTEKVFSTT